MCCISNLHTQDMKQLLSPILFLFLALVLILARYLHANFYCIANPNIFILDAFITLGYLWFSKKICGMMCIHFFSFITSFVYLFICKWIYFRLQIKVCNVRLNQESNNSLASALTEIPGFSADLCIRFTLQRKGVSVGEKKTTVLAKAAK